MIRCLCWSECDGGQGVVGRGVGREAVIARQRSNNLGRKNRREGINKKMARFMCLHQIVSTIEKLSEVLQKY